LKIVIDSYAWIEQFTGNANSSKIIEIFINADELYTPDIVLAEVARKYIRDRIADNIIKIRLQQIEENSKIVNLSPKLAFEAAKCYAELLNNARQNKLNTPNLSDAIILATARILGAKVLTGDQHFKPFSETLWI
jgi:predicted nucleic acid-binding protein